MFACLQHKLLSADRCPVRGLTRRRFAAAAGLHPAAGCPNLITRGHLCGTDLRTIPARALPADDHVIDSQRGSTRSWRSSKLDKTTQPTLSQLATPGYAYPGVAYPASKAAVNMITVQYAKAVPNMRINAVELASPRPT